MKKLFLIFIVFTSLFGSSRENDVNLSFIQTSKKLLSADGYSKNISLGEWVKNKNILYDKKVSKSDKSIMFQNFDYISLSKIQYKNNDYFVLLVEKDNGYFEYPNIRKNWINYKETIFMVFDKEDIEKIKEYILIPQNNPMILKKSYEVASLINNRFKHLGGEHSYSKKVLMSEITRSVKNMYNNKNSIQYSYFIFPIFSTIENGKHVIRFKIPFLNDITPKNHLVKDAFFIRIKTDSLEYDYFEIPAKQFQDIFNL